MISAVKFRVSRILQQPSRFKRNCLNMICSTILHWWGFNSRSAASLQVFELIIMIKENNSILVHFQTLCKPLNWNSLIISLYWRITWFRWALEARIGQKISCYLESENIDALITICCSALLYWYFRIGKTFPRADSCFRTAHTHFIYGRGQNRSAAQAWEVDFQWEPPQCFRRSDPLNRGYLRLG